MIIRSRSLPVLVWMGAIFVLSSIQGDVDAGFGGLVMKLDPQWQNFLHVPLYAVLQILLMRCLYQHGFSRWSSGLASVVVTVGYGAFDEMHQMWVPGRYASLLDMLLNALGAVVGLGLYVAINNYRKRIIL